MNMYHSDAYRAAFLAYIRKGTPIRRSLKQSVDTAQYVWRTQQDDKVRASHRANDGRVFSWSSPPPTGHPGQEFNCRCQAIPYISGETEFAYHDITTDLSSPPYRWTDIDFVAHYYYGDGLAVDLREIGHLSQIVEQYAWNDGAEGAFRRLADQIAEEGRNATNDTFSFDFRGSYEFGDVEFSHGGGTVDGIFCGTVEKRGDMLEIRGTSEFSFTDEFIDPLDIGIEVGGTPYSISGNWSADFTERVFANRARSIYSNRNRE